MQTFLFAVLGAFIGAGYEAYQGFELVRTGAYSLTMGLGIVAIGAIIGAVVFASASIAYRKFASRR